MTGSRITGRGYKIGPTLHAAVGIFNCPMEEGTIWEIWRGESATTQQCKEFMPKLKTGNNSWRENGDRNMSFVSPWPVPPFHQKHRQLSVPGWAAECPGIKSVRAKLLPVRNKPWQPKQGLYLLGTLPKFLCCLPLSISAIPELICLEP